MYQMEPAGHQSQEGKEKERRARQGLVWSQPKHNHVRFVALLQAIDELKLSWYIIIGTQN